MKIILYILIILIIILLAVLLKNKNLFVTIVCSLIILEIIASPKLCIDGAVSGALLFFYKVFPSLFSFLIVSNVIMAYDGIYIYSKILGNALCRPLRLPKSCSFVLMISLLCGYPLGAKYACDLYEKNIINLKTCERLLNIASNASPLFVLGSVGISMLKDSKIGYILLLSNALSCIAMGFFLPADIYGQKNGFKGTHTYSNSNIGNVLKSSIENSIKTCLSIGGFVTLFSVVNNIVKNNYLFNSFSHKLSLLLNTPQDILQGFLLGIIEMTNGCNLVSASNSSILLKIALVSFLFTFSGLSIISQVYSFTYKFNISMKKYAFRKILQGISCSIISIILYKLMYFNQSKQSFNINYISTYSLEYTFIITIIFLIILPWITFKIKKLFHIP
ncbi:membrane protein [Clostridium carboxidivorans P7]|uniref:Sporulation integral membrane protein YlbJ n=1 Tax=Clostridium carboxidivorans P7 TaxID=536227 RepID=C6PR17_9CLOT|nr:sporulation integral membrane protein YlbJ [Clostridium carboxidivorans]AKN29429.1 membrane protein [Clostridium carboxidivorans P7]EET88381.1 sporulation integral membrane protein YlbJ [Clostridium carboxidivorans P7]EFG89652.1 sporulation integral membrane protein YlbJ [Clostridium carboxidivorans P7]